jgi:peptide/nickel transport system permease protein
VRSATRRILGSLLLVWLVVSSLFLLLRAAPGDPVQFMLPPGATAEEEARLSAELGLDAPVAVQYARWVSRTLRGDLGESFTQRRPVVDVLATTLPVSLFLGMTSLTLTFIIGVALGIVQAARMGSRTDTALTIISTAVYAAPSYWLALALVAVFTYGAATLGFPAWARLPAFGMQDPAADLHGLARAADFARHAVLPIFVLTAIGAAGIARYSRTSVADVMTLEFVRTARAKGVPPRGVFGRHVLANVLPSLIVLVALSLPGIVSGAVFVETVFAWPGMGRALVLAISSRDYPLVMGAALIYGTLVIFSNLAADLLLPLVDPRRRQ